MADETKKVSSLEEQDAKVAMLEKMLLEQNAAIAEMKKSKADAPNVEVKKTPPVVPEDPFTVDGKKYKWLVGKFRFPGEGAILSAKADEETKDFLVENKRWGIIKAV